MQRKGRAGERSVRLRLPLAGGLVEEMGAVWLWENDRSVDAVRGCVRWVFGAGWGAVKCAGVALKCVANWRRYHALRRPARLLCCFDGASALLPIN